MLCFEAIKDFILFILQVWMTIINIALTTFIDHFHHNDDKDLIDLMNCL